MKEPTNKLLWTACKRLPTDFTPYGEQQRLKVNCSTCESFQRLAGPKGKQWGICASDRSPRAGLLTYRTQGGMFCFTDDKGWVNQRGVYQKWPSKESLRLVPPLSKNAKPVWRGPIQGFLELRRQQREERKRLEQAEVERKFAEAFGDTKDPGE